MERDLKSVERKSRNRERKSGRNIEEMWEKDRRKWDILT